MYGIVISVEEPAALWRIDPKNGKKVYEPCDSCCAMMGCKQRRECAPHCQRQFEKAHEEAEQVSDFYEHFSSMTVQRLRNPTVDELDSCLERLAELSPTDGCEAIMVYYIGHGVEYKNNMHIVLQDGNKGHLKYNLQ